MTGKRLFVVVCVISLGLITAAPAMDQQSVENRIDRMEKDIQTLSRAVYRGEKPPEIPRSAEKSALVSDRTQADMELRISRIERELLELTGSIEQQNFKIRQMQDTLDHTVSDMEMRLSELEMQLSPDKHTAANAKPGANTAAGPDTLLLNSAGSVKTPSLSETAGSLGTLIQKPDGLMTRPEASGAQTPDGQYEKAFSALRSRDYATAEKGFQDFLDKYPDHKLAPNAKYWLGETYYVRNDYERAARIFAESYQQYPKGNKGPDSLLKLALSLAGMGSTKDACLALEQLERQYTSGPKPILVRAGQEKSRLSCP